MPGRSSIVEQLVFLTVCSAVVGVVWSTPATTATRNHRRLYYRTSAYILRTLVRIGFFAQCMPLLSLCPLVGYALLKLMFLLSCYYENAELPYDERGLAENDGR